MASRELKVFISSTSLDLQEHRAVARLAVLNMNWIPVMMEHFGALTSSTVQACAEQLSACDLMVLLVAHHRGGVPAVEQGGNGRDSYTALELAKAREKGIPVLALMADKAWPGDLWEEEDEARKWVKSFREGLNLPAVFFRYEEPTASESERFPGFRSLISQVLVKYDKERPRRPENARITEAIDYTDSAIDAFVKGDCLPLVGPGVFDPGPLSPAALSSALLGNQASGEVACLATAAEYFEQLHRSREDLLAELASIIEEQSARVKPTPVHELLAMTRLSGPPPAVLPSGQKARSKSLGPPVVVSTSLDLVLERALDAAGARYAIVTHVLRSRDSKYDGRLLVLRKDAAPALCMSDQLELSDEQFVVYRPLGSPLLHQQLDPDDEIDTVVVTETDHMLFLGRLQNEQTQVPAKFSLPFQKRHLVFLGFPLDVWQYRLIVQMFDVIRTIKHSNDQPKRNLAVREAVFGLEELAWQRLGVDLIQSAPNAFASSAIAAIRAEGVSHAA